MTWRSFSDTRYTAEMLNDDAIGRVLDRIYEYGTWKIFSEVCVEAFRSYGIDASVVHHDTTSVSVWGEYAPAPQDPLRITFGHSKDKRPDLKQFMISLLCVEGNLPCHGGILDGNAADKKTNGKILDELPRIMARHGAKEFTYVADAALATKENLSLMGDDIRFITRLPANFGACGRLISTAVASGSWQDVGQLSHRTGEGQRRSAPDTVFRELRIDIYGRTYRAIVVHSDVHDRRRQKRIDKAVEKDAREVVERAWRAFAQGVLLPSRRARRRQRPLRLVTLHEVSCSFESRPVYGRGRPRKSGDTPCEGSPPPGSHRGEAEQRGYREASGGGRLLRPSH